MSAIGSIYVEVKGNITDFQKSLEVVRKDAKASGKEISNALNNAVLPEKARKSLGDLSAGLVQLAQSAKAPAANFKQTAAEINKAFGEVAQKIGMTSKEFTSLNEKMLRNQAMSQADAAMKSVARSAGLTSKEVHGLAVQMGYTSQEAAKMAASFSKASTSSGSMLGSIMSFRAGILSVGLAVSGVVYSIKSMGDAIFEAGQRTLVAENAYKAITGSAQKAGVEFNFLRKTSEDLGLNFYTLRDGYKGFLAAAQSSKIPMGEVREIFKSISNAGAVMGLSNERMSLTFLALEQIMSKGKVSMEELRRQLGDSLPGAFQIGAKAMGMTVEAFDKAVSAGEVYSDEFLPKFRVAMDEAFKGTVADSVKAVNKLAEAWEDLKNRMVSSGFMDSVTKAMKSLTETFKDPSVIEGMQMFAQNLGRIVESMAKLSKYAGLRSVTGTFAEAAQLSKQGLLGMSLEAFSEKGFVDRQKVVDQAKELKKVFDEKATHDSWVLTSYQRVKSMGEYVDPAIRNAMKARTDIAKFISTIEEDALKRASKTDAEILKRLESELEAYKKTGKAKADVVEQYEKDIADVRERMAAPGIKADKKSQEAKEELNKALGELEKEYKKLTMTALDYQKYELEEWKLTQLKTKGITAETEELKKLYEIRKAIIAEEEKNGPAGLSSGISYDADPKDQAKEITDAWEKMEKDKADALKDYEAANKKSLEKQQKDFENFSEKVQDFTADIISDWDNMGDALIKIMKRTLAEMAAAIISQQLVIPIATSMGSALGMNWNGTPFSAMTGGGSGGGMSPMSMLSSGNSLYNAFSGGASSMLRSGPMADIGSSIFGPAAWFGGAAAPSASAFGFAGGNFAAATGMGTSTTGLATSFAAAVPWLAVGALAIPLIMSMFEDDPPDPLIGFHFGQGNAPIGGGAVSEKWGFNTFSQMMPEETSRQVKKYFESQFEAVDAALKIDFNAVVKSRQDRPGAEIGTGWNTEGGVEGALKEANDWIMKNVLGEMVNNAYGMAEAFGDSNVTEVFEELAGDSGSFTEAMIRFGVVMDNTQDYVAKFSYQMATLGGDAVKAFTNMEAILGIFTGVEALVNPLLKLTDPLVVLVDQFNKWDDALIAANANFEELLRLDNLRTQAMGMQLTGLSANNLGQSIQSALTGGGNLAKSIKATIGQAMAGNLATSLANTMMETVIAPFNAIIGQEFDANGNDLDALFAKLPSLMEQLQIDELIEGVGTFSDKWKEMFEDLDSTNAKNSLEALESAIDSIMGGKATVQSRTYFEGRYSDLMAEAQADPTKMGKFASFSGEYLDFLKDYGDPKAQERVLAQLTALRDSAESEITLGEEITGGKTLADIYEALIFGAYADIGRGGIGSGVENIDQAGYDYWENQLENGTLTPETFNDAFENAINNYITANPTSPMSQYVSERTGNITVKVMIGTKELSEITTEIIRTDSEAQAQIRRVVNV